jgi:clan AA aspartic protease (TIGR02281 family)
MLVDTGAGDVALNEEDMKKIGKDCKSLSESEYKKVTYSTANGKVEGKQFPLSEITVAGIVLPNVNASCGGDLKGTSLLGQSALKRFNITFTNTGYMLLSRPN